MIKIKLMRAFSLAVMLGLISILISPLITNAQTRTKEKPQTALEIMNYEWRTGGTGKQAVLKSITIHNRGKKTYEKISIEVDLYSNSDVPQGSIKAIINDSIPGGLTKTFENVNFGIMNTELEQTVFRITGAELARDGNIFPSDVISVVDWEWSGASYGTEGILQFITLENKGDKSYKDIQIIIESSNVGDKRAVPFKAVIKDVLPANSVQTYENINVGFRYSGAGSTVISVLDAKRVSKKELRHRMAKKGIKVDVTAESEQYDQYDAGIDSEDRTLSLAERYRKNVLKIDPESGKLLDGTDSEVAERDIISPMQEEPEELKDYRYMEEKPRYSTRIDNALNDEQMLREQAKLFPEIFKEIVIVSASAEGIDNTNRSDDYRNENFTETVTVYDKPLQEKKKNIFKRAINWSKDLVGLSEDEYVDDEEEYIDEQQVAIKSDANSDSRHPYTDIQNETTYKTNSDVEKIEDYKLEGDEYQEPIPSLDIEVSGFKLDAALTGTMGSFQEITLTNNSRITYSNIKLEATSYARIDKRPLASYKFTINEILPRRTKRTFRNIRFGFLSSEPEDVVIRVIDAVNIN